MLEAARSDWAIANHEKLQEQAGVSKDSVSMYRCPACKSEKVSSFAMQTRSADEPMTVFCTCLNPKCGKKIPKIKQIKNIFGAVVCLSMASLVLRLFAQS